MSLVAAKGISPSQFGMPTAVAVGSDYAAYLRLGLVPALNPGQLCAQREVVSPRLLRFEDETRWNA